MTNHADPDPTVVTSMIPESRPIVALVLYDEIHLSPELVVGYFDGYTVTVSPEGAETMDIGATTGGERIVRTVGFDTMLQARTFIDLWLHQSEEAARRFHARLLEAAFPWLDSSEIAAISLSERQDLSPPQVVVGVS